MKLAGKKVLVTGATGFIGSALCRRLLDENVILHAVSRNDQESSNDRFHWWNDDLTKFDQTRELIITIRPDLIFHVAGLGNGANDPALIYPTFVNNALTTVNLLVASQAVGCEKFIYAASMLEPDLSNFSDVPNSPYAASKLTASIYTKMFYELFSFPVVLLRTCLVFGPGPEPERRLIPHTILSLLKNEPPIIRNAARKLDFIYIDDVVDAYLLAAQEESSIGKIIDVGSGHSISISDVITKIADIIDCGVRPVFDSAPSLPENMMPAARLERTEKLLHWRPRVSLENGLRKTVAWYKNSLKEQINRE